MSKKSDGKVVSKIKLGVRISDGVLDQIYGLSGKQSSEIYEKVLLKGLMQIRVENQLKRMDEAIKSVETLKEDFEAHLMDLRDTLVRDKQINEKLDTHQKALKIIFQVEPIEKIHATYDNIVKTVKRFLPG